MKYYAIKFVSIGFDLDCNSSGELEYDDLGFMKQLHRRYFWKEWEKLFMSREENRTIFVFNLKFRFLLPILILVHQIFSLTCLIYEYYIISVVL